jgi:hypothetical protein
MAISNFGLQIADGGFQTSCAAARLKSAIRLLVAVMACLSVAAGGAKSANPAGTRVFNVLDFGAANDGSSRATAAVRRAIQACSAAGGGTVYFPAGAYLSGAIELASNITLYLDAGATLRFHTDLAEYPLVKGRHEGIEGITPAPLIGGQKLENVAISGRGTLTTDNEAWLKQMNQPEARAMWESIIERIEKKQAVPEADYRKAALALRPSFIRFMESRNVLVEGIHIAGSSMWAIHPLYCENFVIRNVIVETYPGRNTDGVDVDSSRDVRISDSYFDTGDDAIVIKSGKDADGRRVNRPTENIAVTNCTVRHGHGAVVIGSETAGGVRNVVASNIVANGTQRGVRIKSGRGRGGTVESIRFDNWVIQGAEEGINVTNYYTRVPEEPVSERTPVFRDIALTNMTITGSATAINIEGLPEMPIDGLRISGVAASAVRGLLAHDTQGLELRNIQINTENGPAFLIKDSKQLLLSDAGTSRPHADAPVVRLDNCPDALFRGSRAWPGTAVFLSVAPGQGKSVALVGNLLGPAKTPVEETPTDFWKAAAKKAGKKR